MNTTSIEWTRGDDGTPGQTWNPVRGCSIVSPGCVNCYAMKQAHRFSGPDKPYEGLTKLTKAGPQWTGVVRCIEDALDYPLKLRKPHRIFVNSMSDLFHEDVPDAFIDRVFAVMALAPQHTFQILTKRAERMRDYMERIDGKRDDDTHPWIDAMPDGTPPESPDQWAWPLPNVWLGVSVEDQPRADERIPLLLQTPAAVRFISAEPLLGEVRLVPYLGYGVDIVTRQQNTRKPLDWVIVGGESGPVARPFDLAWARAIVQQCQSAGVPVFYKQGGTGHRCQHDSKGGCLECAPADLRVREYPSASRS